MTTLWHVSENGDIAEFRPRPRERGHEAEDTGKARQRDVVWAVGERRLANYLLPRDCPRVTFYRASQTTDADASRFAVAAAQHVVVIEAAWMQTVRDVRLWLYQMPADGFHCIDENAAYFVTENAVTPVAKHTVTDVTARLVALGAELRTVENLQVLASEVARSTLGFSIIRLSNAKPPLTHPNKGR